MKGGFEEGYGSGSSAPVPSDRAEDERESHPDVDGSLESPPSGDAVVSGSESNSESEDEIPRQTRRFRAWGAAHEPEPSLWERFAGWLRSLFSRKPARDTRADETFVAEARPVVGLGTPRTSFDDLDAPWNEDPYPVQERRSSRPSSERPSIEDFAVTWDGTYGREEEAEPEPAEPPAVAAELETPVTQESAADADPLWDSPVVSETSAPPPQAFVAQDLESVWTPRDEVADEAPAAPPVVPEPPKQGFFARLFGRKPKRDAEILAEQERAAAAMWATDLAEVADNQRDLEPADADFAEDISAATVPMDDDFASEAVPPAPQPSTDHSAEDAAKLAALLGPIPSVEADFADEAPTEIVVASVVEVVEVIEEPVEEVEEPTAAESAVAEERIAAEPPIEEEPIAEELTVVADDAADVSVTVVDVLQEPEVLPEQDVPSEPEALPPAPEPEPAKKPGFFSGLLRRVSRAQFIPKAAIEPEPPPAPEPEIEIAASAEVVEEVHLGDTLSEPIAPPTEEDDLETRWGPPLTDTLAEPVAPPLTETLSEPMAPPVAPMPASAPSEMESTQPFPAFRDARDDFEEEEAVAAVDSGRPTEQVDIPAFDEGEKTDEFEVVPPAEDLTGTAEAPSVGFFGRLLGRNATDSAEISAEAPAAPPVDDKTPFVLAKFRTFYNEVIRDKNQKSDVISGFATAVLSAPPSDLADPEFAAQLLSKRLSEMLELQSAESNWTGGDAAKYYPEAQYAMVALADETFATIDWPGRSAWHKHMLEPRMYGTRGADVEFFKRIDKLLKDNPDPPKGARDLARLYLLVIASGFRGKFRVPNVRRPLAEYRRRLYEFSHQADPLELYAKDRQIFPEAIEHTLASRAVGRFTSAQKWVAAVFILTVLYLGVSHYAWTRLSADLKDVMVRIQSSISQSSPR